MHTFKHIDVVGDLLSALCPFGSLDIRQCVEILIDAGVCFYDFGCYYTDFLEDVGWSWSINRTPDVCALALDYILQKARTEIEEKTKVDILNDLKNEIYVYGNYCCSSFDFSDSSEVLELIKKIEEPSHLLTYFKNQIS
jgi:hypothetical protein